MSGVSSGLMHEALKRISWLAGKWSTQEGHGHFPNVPEFQYHEDLEFICIGQPMLNYISSSRHPEKQTPMHQERGFLRIKPGSNDLAFVVSHNFGLTSLEEGSFNPDNNTITLETVNVSRISFAKPPYVKKFKRVIKLVDDNTLEVILHMETDGTPLTEHLKAVYKRVHMIETKSVMKRALRQHERGQSSSTMSPNTRGFLQKICYRRGASVDMTQYGFIADSKAHPVNLLLKPLRDRLERICAPTKLKVKSRTSNPVRKVPPAKKRQKPKGYFVCRNLNQMSSNMIVCDEPSSDSVPPKLPKKAALTARALSSKVAPMKKRSSNSAKKRKVNVSRKLQAT